MPAFAGSVISLSGARVFAVALQLAVLPIVARYVDPAEFGLVALSMVFVGLAMALSDAGLGKSLLRDGGRDELVWSSAFWMLCGFGLVLALCVLAAAPFVALIYDAPRLARFLSVLALVPLLQSISAVFVAELESRHAFLPLALALVLSSVLSAGVAIGLAMNGAGAWALIAQQVTLFAVQAIWYVLGSTFRPRVAFSRQALGAHLKFGSDTLGWAMLQFVIRESLRLVIGFVGTMAQLGAFAMAMRFLRVPSTVISDPVSRVVYVRMAAQHATQGAVRDLFIQASGLLAVIVIPPIALLAAASEPVFVLLLSEEWSDVGLLFTLLAPGFALQIALSPNGTAFMARGRTDLRLRVTTEMAVLWLLMLPLAASFGAIALVAARSVWFIAFLPRMAVFTRRAFDVGLGDIMALLRWPVLVSTAGFALQRGLSHNLMLGPWGELALALVLLMLVWGAILLLSRGRLRDSYAALKAGMV
ncbi:oligosaccharide flippase family protein [Limimaricola sp.]|uniref:oligosaccharide flippase family protein n=1 Tax=Limimaricola sp. TaxID=2211665 RepID=UPI004058E866